MARIRIVDEWLRSPVTAPVRRRAIMVVSKTWSEQRVLMRAFAQSGDQTRPTIVLHGKELAIGPAGTDPHGPWGIHVEPPVDGRAQELREQLELAAKRAAGSKGNPPRLADELSKFEGKATNHWAPGAPRDRESQQFQAGSAAGKRNYFEPVSAAGSAGAKPAAAPAAPAAPAAAPRQVAPEVRAAETHALEPLGPADVDRHSESSANPGYAAASAVAGVRRPTPQMFSFRPRHGGQPAAPQHRGWESPIRPSQSSIDRPGGARTVVGFAGADSPVPTPVPAPPRRQPSPGFAGIVSRTMPLGFQLSDQERQVLNALGREPALTASEVAEIAEIGDAVEWMETFMTKLADHGLDLVIPGDDRSGEPTYMLRR